MLGIEQEIIKIKKEQSALDKRLEKMGGTEGSSIPTPSGTHYAEKEIKTTFHTVQLCTKQARYGVQYAYLRPLQFIEESETILCAGDGYQFVIEGGNMLLLFEMMCARAVACIKQGEKIEIGETVIDVKSVIAEPMQASE